MKGPRRLRLPGFLPALLLTTLLFLATGPQNVSADTVVLTHFGYGNTNATLNFTDSNDSMSSELFINIPRGAAVIDANVSIRGIEGPGMANYTMDYSTHSVGPDMWALQEGATGIVPLDVDPYNTTWDPMPSAQVSNVSAVDSRYWHTETPTTPTAAPWEWPVQLFHFRPSVEDAVRYEISWRGKGYCAANTTVTKYHAEMWIYDFSKNEWDNHTAYWDWLDHDAWLNDTAYANDLYVSSNGSIVVAVSGAHAEVNGTVTDYGHLYTDYIALVAVGSSQEDEYPEDVTLHVFDTWMRVADGPLSGTVEVGDAHGLPDAIQDHIDHYPNQPGNVTVGIDVYVARTTYAQVEVFDLHITYDDSGVIPNDPPVWRGPDSVDVKEDTTWKAVLDMDLSFTDDYDQRNLEFSIVDISNAYLEARLSEGLLGHTWLEVQPADNFNGDVDITLGATDSARGFTEAPLTVHVQQVPDPPFILDLGLIPVNESERLNFTFLVLDPDMPDDTLTFSDTSDLFDVDPEEGSVDWTPGPEHVGTHTCTVTVRDRYGLSDRTTLVIEVLNVNDPPVIVSELSMDTLEGKRYYYMIVAEDPDLAHGDVLTFSATSFEVDVQVDTSTGQVTFTTEKGFVGDLAVFIKVTDALGFIDQATLTVHVGNVNDPPTLADIGRLTYSQGDEVSVRLDADDPDLELELDLPEVLSFTTEGPDWLAADPEGWINLTVDQSMVGEHLVKYTVIDREGLEYTISVIWSLENVNDGPAITTEVQTVIVAREDEVFTLTIEATDLDGDVLTWSDDSPLFDIGPNSGRVEFTPVQDDVGIHTIWVTVSDGEGGSDSVTFDLRVENVNAAPVIVSVLPSNGTVFPEGEAVRLQVEASDEDGDALEYTWKEENLVYGLGHDLLVEHLKPGTHSLILEVSDGNATVYWDLNFIVKAEEEGSSFPVALVAVAVAIAAGMVALMFFLLRSRR